MKLFSSPKIFDLQPCANKCTFRTKTLEYGDDKRFSNSSSSKEQNGTQGFKIGLSIEWIWPLENLGKFFLK